MKRKAQNTETIWRSSSSMPRKMQSKMKRCKIEVRKPRFESWPDLILQVTFTTFWDLTANALSPVINPVRGTLKRPFSKGLTVCAYRELDVEDV